MFIKVCTATTDGEKIAYNVFEKYDDWKTYCLDSLPLPSKDPHWIMFDCGHIDKNGVYHKPLIYKSIQDAGDYDTDKFEYFLYVDSEGTPLYCATKTETPHIYFRGYKPVPVKFFKYEFYTDDPDSTTDDDTEIEMVYQTEPRGSLHFDLIDTIERGADDDSSAELIKQDLIFYRAYAFDEDDEQLMWGMLINVNNMKRYSFFYDAHDSALEEDELDIEVTTLGNKQIIVIKNRIDKEDSYKIIPLTYIDFKTMKEIKKGYKL